ncbi:MAG: hypothetical protein KAU24_02635, partial [Candidatus Aenigmarchaeota archaeon]|nr:hypothetical protein [Candidatus Aenigmarchaeota archaeon]
MEKKVKFLILMVSVFILVFGLFANFVLSQCDPPCEEPYAFDDDGGDVPSVAGMCTRFSERCEWVGPEIWECDSTVSNFPDSCTGNTLTEFFPIDGRFCTSKTYDCPTVFGAGYACQGGACVACTNDCGAEGLRQCSGIYGDVQECRANWDGDVCFEWGTIESCAANEECRGARCIDPGTCECEGCAFTFDGFASGDDTDVDFVGVRFAPPGECMSELTEDNCNNAEGYFPECSEYCSTVCPEMGYVDCDCEKSPECSSQLDCEIDSGPGYGSTWCYSCDNGDCWYADRGTLCTVKRLGIPSPPPPLHGQCDGGDRCSCWDGMSCNVDMDCEICDDLYSPDDYCCSPSGGCKPYRTREIYDATESDGLGFGGDSNDRACCNNANDCVYNGECFTGGNYYDLNGDGLNEALCYSSNGRWISTDYHTSYCTANNYQWNVGTGDANIDNAYNPTYSGYDWPEGCKGHPDYASTMCCCGDDSGEYYKEFKRYTGDAT